MRRGRHRRHRRSVPPAAPPGPGNGSARHRRPGVRAPGRPCARRRAHRRDGVPAGPGRELGTRGLADVAVPSAAGRALAGRPAGHRGGRAVLVRRFHRFPDRCRRASVPDGHHRGAGGLRLRSSCASPSPRPSSCTTPPSTSASFPATSGPASPCHLGRRYQRGGPRGQRSLSHRWNGSAASSCSSRPTRRWRQAPAIRRVIWRFARDPDAALNLVLSHEADLLETAGSPDRQARVARRQRAAPRPVAAAATDSSAFRSRAGRGVGRHPIFGDAPTRRALALAVDRETLARSTFGRAPRRRRGRCRSCSGSGATAFACSRSTRCRPTAPSTRRAGAGPTARPPGSAAAARSPSTFSCPAPARAVASSPWRCRRCGRRSARP